MSRSDRNRRPYRLAVRMQRPWRLRLWQVMRVISTAPVAMVRADQSVPTDGAASPDLLLVIGEAAGGVNRADEIAVSSRTQSNR